MKASYCREHNCQWLDTQRDVCKSPNDPCGGECDYNWASACPKCKNLIAVGNDDGEGVP